ncbi:MAG: hypothetical protein GC168_06620 [Candidatus Hydrogenedens sp.]|nr:hypothetical protein [Candidatus Hydrogenedens sp.]
MNRVYWNLRHLCAAAAGVMLLAASVPSHAAATAEALAHTPSTAQVSLSLPPLAKSFDAYVAFIKKVAPEVDIDTELKDIVADMSKDAKVEGAETIADVLAAKGIDTDAAITVFANFEKSLEPIRAAQKGDAGEAGDAEDADDADEMEEADLPDPGIPDVALLFGVKDKEAAQKSLDEIIAAAPGISADDTEPVDHNGISVHVYDDYAYFLTDTHVAIGMKDLVATMADEYAAPKAVSYGDTLAAGPNEIVAMIDGKKFMPLLEEAMPAIAEDMDDAQLAMLKQNLDTYAKAFASGDGAPGYLTLSLDDKRVDLATHMDTAANPGLLEISGDAQPFRLSPLLPDNTLTFLTFKVNDQFREQFKTQIAPGIGEAVGRDPAEIGMYANQVAQMIGDEVTIGISGAENDFPAAFIMLALAQPEQTKGLLQMLVPAKEAEVYNDTPINAIAAPIPVPLSMAYPGDFVLVSNNMDGMKAIIDLSKEGKSTEFFSKLNDPLKTDQPRYMGLVLKTKLFTDVVIPLSALAGGVPEDAKETMTRVAELFDELRIMSGVEGNWAETRVTGYLN